MSPKSVCSVQHGAERQGETGYSVSPERDAGNAMFFVWICRNEGDVGFDMVTIYGEKPTGNVPTPSFP
jgi:hypothetical protein